MASQYSVPKEKQSKLFNRSKKRQIIAYVKRRIPPLKSRQSDLRQKWKTNKNEERLPTKEVSFSVEVLARSQLSL